jgi:hypothetical protein
MSDKRGRIQYALKTGEKDYDEIKPIVEFCTMSQELRDICINKAKEALQSVGDSHINYFKDIAQKIKMDLEADRNETWNCVVGSDFGAYIAFDKANLVFFRMNEIYFMIFRFGAASK